MLESFPAEEVFWLTPRGKMVGFVLCEQIKAAFLFVVGKRLFEFILTCAGGDVAWKSALELLE